MIYYTKMKTEFGELGLVKDNNNLVKIYLPNEKINTNVLKKDFLNQTYKDDKSHFTKELSQLREYFDGKRKKFNINIKLNLSSFFESALREVSKIPYGTTASYANIANILNNPKAVRAVGSANANNPIPIIIPCHRVINKNGKLGGYGGGLEMKTKLLKLELNNN